MKKMFLTLGFSAVLTVNAFAQSFSFNIVSDPNITNAQPWELFEIHGDLTNLTNDTLFIFFERLTNNLPGSLWQSSICVNTNCLAPFVDSEVFSVPPNETYDFRMNITPGTTAGQGHVVAKLSNNANLTEFFTQDYYVTTDTAVVSLEENSQILPTFVLEQNFPNPFNPTTTINYEFEATNLNLAKLSIFNVLGQAIKEFALTQPKGSVVWNGTDNLGNDVSNGIYFYRLEAGNQVETRKMILMK